MGMHKSKNEWKYWFNKYKSDTLVWKEYFKRNSAINEKNARSRFRKKYRDCICVGESIIISMTGKNSKSRPKKRKVPDFDNWSRDELKEVARRYYEITRNKKKCEKDKELSSLRLSKSKISIILSISRSGMYYIKKMNQSLTILSQIKY